MADLGELFIQLAFEGDTKEAEKFKKTLNETAKIMQKTAKKAVENAKAQLKGAKATEESNKQTKESNKHKKTQENNFKNITKSVTGYIAAISGAIFAVKKLTDSLIEQNQTWLNLTRTSDIALSTYQKWNSIGKMYGIDNAAMQIKNLNDRLFELKLTGANSQGFMLAGIKPTNAEDVMEQLRARVSGLNDTSASYLLRQMGLDENMLHILRLSRAEFNSLNKEMKQFQLTDEQRNSIQEMNVQLQIASQKLQYLKDRAVLAIMPYWIEFIKSITRVSVMLAKTTVSVGEFVKKFRGIFIVAAATITKLKPVTSFLGKFSGIINSLITKIPLFGRLLGGIGKIFTKWLLPLTAIYLLLDDLSVFMGGGDSVFGDIVNYFKDFGEDFKNIFAMFNADPLYGLYAILVKISDVFIQIARAILKTVDIMFGTPFAKWLDNWLENQNYGENLKNLSENLSEKAQQAKSGELTRFATSNINKNTRSVGNYAPTYNITTNSPTTKEIQNLQKNDYAQANFYFAQGAV